MAIQDWGAIGELIGAIAVIVTLFYVALQIRQNTRAIRLSTSHAVTEEVRDMFALLAEHGGLAELVQQASMDAASIGGADKLRYWSYNNNFVRAFENAYIQWTQDALDPRHWAGIKRMVTDYTHVSGFREFWPNRKHWYSDEFQHFMDAEILQSEAQTGVPLPGEY
jgi:hypothetical protein